MKRRWRLLPALVAAGVPACSLLLDDDYSSPPATSVDASDESHEGDAGTDASSAEDADAGTPVVVDAAFPEAGIELRLEAFDANLQVDAGRVEVWKDTSGNGRDAVQTDPTSRPTVTFASGRTTIRFDGTNDFLETSVPIAGATEATMATVTSCVGDPDPGVYGYFRAALTWSESSAWGISHVTPLQSTVWARWGTTQVNNFLYYERPSSIGTAATVTIVVHDGAEDRLYVDGLLALTQGGKLSLISGSVDPVFIGRGGGSTHFPGDILGVYVYSRALPDTERTALEAYLREAFKL